MVVFALRLGIVHALPYLTSSFPSLCWLSLQSNNLNESRIDVYVSETPAGTSVKNMAHWSQGVTTDAFQMFNYGCNALSCPNKQYYNQSTPPQYDLGNIHTPIGEWAHVMLSLRCLLFAQMILCCRVTLSCCHPVTLSRCHPVTLSRCHPVALSRCHPVTLSLCHPVTLSPCHAVTLSHCHAVTLASGHPDARAR